MFTPVDVLDEEYETRAAILEQLDMASVLSHKETFDIVMQSFPPSVGNATSKRERESARHFSTTDPHEIERAAFLRSPNLIYGEISFEAMGSILEKIRKVFGKPFQGTSGPDGVMQLPGGKFYDLGAGIGKAVIGAAILHPFEFCIGIECLEGIYSLSLDALHAFNTRGKPRLSMREIDTHCQFVHGDILKVRTRDWRDGDVVFVNSCCFEESLMEKLAILANGMKKGSFLVTTTKRIPSSEFDVVDYSLAKMSWGSATVFISQKKTEPHAGRAAAALFTNEEEEEKH